MSWQCLLVMDTVLVIQGHIEPNSKDTIDEGSIELINDEVIKTESDAVNTEEGLG